MSITFDGTNIAEVAGYAGEELEGTALLIRHRDGHLTLVQAGFVLDRCEDGLDIWSPQAWRRKQARDAA